MLQAMRACLTVEFGTRHSAFKQRPWANRPDLMSRREFEDLRRTGNMPSETIKLEACLAMRKHAKLFGNRAA
jgi:hypothetical protein